MQSFKLLMGVAQNKRWRRWLALGVLLLTITLIAHFFEAHRQDLSQLRHVRPIVILLIIALYAAMINSLVWVYDATLKVCGAKIPIRETALLTAYSSVINFFGPLQSGPGVRAVYLKTRHQVRLRDYTFATLIYYAIFAITSVLFLVAGAHYWWQAFLLATIVGSLSWLVIHRFRHRQTGGNPVKLLLQPLHLANLGLATLTQLTIQASIYFIELRSINPTIHASQALSYAGAANLALFVSLTPGAIGFRESFLVFSRHLHHVSTANILSASIIDRSSYIIFLLILFSLALSIHAKERLHLTNWRREGPKSEQ